MNAPGLLQIRNVRGGRSARAILFGSLCISLAHFGAAQAVPSGTVDSDTLAKYDANKDGRLDAAETARMNADKQSGNSNEPVDDETILLSPFEVVSDATGYYQANSMSGTRFNTKVEDLASSLTIVTKEQMSDFAMLDINDVFLYTANTEGTGTYTDYTLDRNGSFQDNVQTNPTQANRVRGIAPANISLNNIETMGRTPIDPILVEGIELSRGPNANVFGLGNPSGTVNQVPVSANLTRNRGSLGMRVDSFGGYRTSLDVNRVLIEDKLALRGSAVFQHDGFELKPSGVDTERYNGMIKFQPFKSTTLSASYFYYHSYGNRPNAIPPRDNVSYWVRAGKPTWDPVARVVHLGTATLGPFGTTAAYNGPDYFSTGNIGGNSSQLYIDQGGIAYWSAPQGYSNPSAPVAGPGTTLPVQANWLVHTTGIEGAIGTAAVPAGQPLFRTTPTVSDKSIYDWSSINLASVNFAEDKASTTSVQLDQIFLNSATQTLAVQVGMVREELRRFQRNFIGLANDNGQSGQLEIDVNERRLDGSVNPFFLRPFIATDRPRTQLSPAKWDTYRAQASYRIDFTQRENALKWLGTLQFSPYYEYKYRIDRQYSWRDAIVDNKPWIPAGMYRGTQAAPTGTPARIGLTQSLYRYYVGDNQGNNVDYAPTDFAQGTYNYNWGNAATGVFRNEATTLGLVGSDKTGGNFNTKVVRKTTGIVAQGHFLEDRLVATFGVREDKQYNQFGNQTAQFLNSDGVTFNPAIVNGWDGVWRSNKGRTTNVQFVVRPFRDAAFAKSENFFSSVLGGLSLLYNDSDSFLPLPPAQDLPDDPSQEYVARLLPDSTGKEKSYGVGFNLFDGKVVLRVTRYDNKQFDARSTDANTIAQRVIRTDLPLVGATAGRFMLANVAGATVSNAANFNRLGWIKIQNPGWTDAQVQAELATVMKMHPSVIAALTSPTPPIGATSDLEAKGTEIELNYNPTNYWTVSANVTDTKSIVRNVSTSLQNYINQRMTVWTTLRDPIGPLITGAGSAADDNQLWWNNVYPGANATTGTAAQNFFSFVATPYNVLKQLEGKSSPQVRRYNFRGSTNLRLGGLTEHRFLKNVNVGGALRWEDKAAIGYYGVQQLPATITQLDVNNPIYNRAHFYLDLFVGYRTKLWSDKLGATFQLNVRNLGESGRLQPIASFPDGTKNAYRIVDPAQYIFSVTFDL